MLELDQNIANIIAKGSSQTGKKSKKRLDDNKDNNNNMQYIKEKKSLYESLFYYLQSQPSYFIKLSKYVAEKDTKLFVQTIVFDMYGDQYNNREERLLLSIFQGCLKEEIANSTQGAVMRGNTPLTQMLAAYAKRGQGLNVLKNVLYEPINQLISDSTINLEINPQTIYNEYIKDHPNEKLSNKDDINNHEIIQNILKERIKSLLKWCQIF